MKTILIVDDEPNIVDLLRLYLEKEGYRVLAVGDGRSAVSVQTAEEPDLVVLDLMLPGIDGLEVCRRIRRTSDVPIVMLTARDDDLDVVVGLEVGADDYVAKPFHPRTLVARIRAVLRRADTASRASRPYACGSLTIDPRRREADVSGRRLELRPREFDLLAALAREPGIVLTRDALLEDVWGTDFSGETRTIDVHVGELRRKLGRDGPVIDTVRGVGYRLLAGPRGTADEHGDGSTRAEGPGLGR